MSRATELPPPTASRFMIEIEARVRAANRDAIARRLPSLDRAQLEAFVEKTAVLRAEYLACAFASDWSTEDLDQAGMAEKRARYEEAIAAFEAVERAIRRGYIEIE